MARVDHAFVLKESPRTGDRAKLLRELAADQRKKELQKLRELKARIADVRKRRRVVTAKQVRRCRARREALQEEIRQKRAAERERINREIREMRDSARKACALRKQAIRTASLSIEQRRRQTLEAERQLQRELRNAEQYAKRRREAFRKSAGEAIAESDDQVRKNLDRELLPVFNRVRRTIRPSPHQSRTEAFLQWVEENPDEVIALRQQAADVELERLFREHAKAERQARGQRRVRPKSKRAALELADVPF